MTIQGISSPLQTLRREAVTQQQASTPVQQAVQHDEVLFAGQSQKPAMSWTRRIATSLAMVGALAGMAVPASAQNTPTSQKVVEWAVSSWKALDEGNAKKDKYENEQDKKDWHIHWNNVQTGLRITDDTLELDYHPIRTKILADGATNTNIPILTVQEAINTAGVFGQALDNVDSMNLPAEAKARLKSQLTPAKVAQYKAELSKLLIPYTNTVYRNADLREAAKNALAQVADTATLKSLSQALLSKGNNAAEVQPYFDVLKRIDPKVALPQVEGAQKIEERALAWIYSERNLEADRKGTDTTKPADEDKNNPINKIEDDNLKNTAQAIVDAINGKKPGHNIPKDELCGASEDALAGLDASLLSPALPCISDGTRVNLAADSLRFLAEREPAKLLPAIAQWLTRVDAAHPAAAKTLGARYESRSGGPLESRADMKVLESLAVIAQNSDVKVSKPAKDLLMKAVGSYPEQVAGAILEGYFAQEVNPVYQTGREILKVLNSNRAETRQLMADLNAGKASLLWKEPKSETALMEYEKLRNSGRQLGVLLMMADREGQRQGLHLPELRKIAEDTFNPELRFPAIAGLAFAQDKDSIPLLLGIAVNNLEDDDTRGLAMAATSFILSEPYMLPAVEKQAIKESMFLFDGVANFVEIRGAEVKANGIKVDTSAKPEGDVVRLGKIDSVKSFRLKSRVNPFNDMIKANYEKWERQNAAVASQARKNGQVAPTVTDEVRLEQTVKAIRKVLNSSSETLALHGQNKEFQDKYLAPMLSYLQNLDRKEINYGLAIPMIEILGKSGYQEAAPLFKEMVTHPEKYGPDGDLENGMSVIIAAIAPALTKLYALQALGQTVNPASPDAMVLHEAIKDPFMQFQMAALKGLSGTGQNLTRQLAAKDLSEEKKVALLQAKEQHVAKTIEYMNRLGKEHTASTQNDRLRALLEFETAMVVDGMGGTEQLLNIASKEMEANQRSPLARTIVQALITKGHKADALEKQYGFDAKKFNFTEKKEYWLEGLHAQGSTGAGAEHAHFDVGYVNPIGPLAEEGKLEHPKWMRWSDLFNWLEPHPTGTAETVRLVAPDQKKTYSWNVAEAPVFDETKTWTSQDGLVHGLEDLTQRLMQEQIKPTTANHSYGFPNFIMYTPQLRNELLDMISAYMEASGKAGVTHFVSAGNGQGSLADTFDPIGTQNALGSRLDKDGKVTKPDSIVYVAASDGTTQKLAPFSSTANPLRKGDAARMFTAPGQRDMTIYQNYMGENEWIYRPLDGTSFSSPNLAGLMAVANAERAKNNLPALTPQERDHLMEQASAPLEGREEWEAGRLVNPVQFVNLAKTFQPGTLEAAAKAKVEEVVKK